MLKVGIVGLANVGKSTLFNALLKKQVAQSANYPFTTIEPNVGVVKVPDYYLERLARIIVDSLGLKVLPPVIPATVRFVDIAGLVKGAYKGEGLGNQFLSHIREVDAIVFVLRGFKNEDIIRSGSIDPKDDLEVLKDELLLKDLETIDKRLDSLSRELRGAKDNDPKHSVLKVLEKAKGLVSSGKWLSDELSFDDLEKIQDLQLLSCKKTIVVVNSDESFFAEASEDKEDLEDAMRISAKMEEELTSLPEEDQKAYLKEVGINEPGLNKLVKKAYEVLGLVSFYTAGEKEIRAWTVKKGSTAPVAAGVIHTDFERGFIAADVVTFNDFVKAGGWKNSRDQGLVKTIGKSEIMPENCVVEFKFNV